MSGMLSKIKNQIKRLWRITPDPAALWWFLGVLALSLSLALLMPMGGVVQWLLETKDKPDTLQLIGWGMGGVLAAIVALALNRRAAAMEKGLIDERFKAAVQSLAGEQPSVRIAAFYQFYYLAKDNPDRDFRSSIFDILCAHLRQITSEFDYRNGVGKKKPTEECQSLLDVLFKKSLNVFVDMKADMKNAYLVGANLSNTELHRADFRDANLSKANFLDANVSEANFQNADVSRARFWIADVSRARFWDANASEANFWEANVSEVNFWDANLSKADFGGANLSKANFHNTNVSAANFNGAGLHGADFFSAKDIGSAKFNDIKIDSETKFPERFREGDHYTVAKEEK